MSVIGGLNTMSRLYTTARGDAYMNTLSGARRPTDDEIQRQAAGEEAIAQNLKDVFRSPDAATTTATKVNTLAVPSHNTASESAVIEPPPKRRGSLNLDSIADPMIRAVFDPSRTDEAGSIHVTDRFTDAQLDEMVRLMKPEYLTVMRQKNLAAGDVRAARRLSFHHLSFKHEGRQILTDCSGFVDSGELVGMCGGPDSGVSALLELLSGSVGSRQLWHSQEANSPAGPGSSHPRDARHAKNLAALHSYIDGYVLYDGKKPSRAFHSIVGFAPKSDVHLPYLTVYETLYFSARLRLPKVLSNSNVRLRVLIMLKVLGLLHVKDTIVGDASIRGVSGGEKRRVGFGVELVAGHSILLADLPTNGLDSASALGLIQSMAYACAGGFSLLFSIVQASQEILSLMDRIIVMSKGHIVYTGPPSHALDFFQSQGFRKPKNKALPQFLEELSANPEKFWQPFLTTKIDSNWDGIDIEAQLLENDGEVGTKSSQSPHAFHLRSSKTPRLQAFEALYTGWLGTTAHAAMQQILDTAHSRPPDQVFHTEQRKIMQVAGKHGKKMKSMPDVVQMVALNNKVGGAHNGVIPAPTPSLPSWKTDPIDDAYETSKVTFHTADDEEFEQVRQPEKQDYGNFAAAAAEPLPEPAPIRDVTPPPPHYATPPLPESPHPSSTPAHHEVKGNIIERWWYSKYHSSFFQQLRSNMDRQVKATYRNTGLWRDVWILAVVIGTITGLLFYQLGTDESGVRQRVSLFFFLLTYVAFNAVQLVPVLSQQRPIYYLQCLHSDWYHSFTYYLTLTVVQLPIVCIETFLLLLPVYGISDLTGIVIGGRFWTAYLILFLNSYIARTFMLLLYAASPNESIADVFNQVTGILFSKLCGFFIPQGSIVAGWYWVFWISWFTYALRAMSINDIGSTNHACVPTPDTECRGVTGDQLLRLLYDMDLSVSIWTDVLSLLYFFLTFNFGAMVLLAYVDWSEADQPEAPDFGNTQNQIDDAIAWQEDQTNNGNTLGGGRKSRRPSLSLVRRTSSEQQPAVTASPMSKPESGGGRFSLRRALGHYTSASKRRPGVSHIVMPINQDDSLDTMEPLALGVGDGAAESPRDVESQIQLNQRSLTLPTRDAMNEAANSVSLTRTQQVHYQHEVHLLDIGKLLGADGGTAPPSTKPTTSLKAHPSSAARGAASTGAILEWSHLSYSVDVKDDQGKPYKRQLLSNCVSQFGVCQPGIMVALMGASGAGKSTLLDVLANKKTGGYVTGSILVDGKPRDESFPHLSAYVEQWDSHSPYSTVREALEFSARLRLAKDLSPDEIAVRVDSTLQILGIKHLEHDQLGGAEGVAGVSQEVRKKCTIGVELVSQPRLLFLDEPTTGLDAAGAFSVCQAIKNLSKHIAVICTIHQPSSELIAMFDSLLLMQPGGQVSYCASVSGIPKYFAEHELGKMTKDRNVSDFALESIRTVTQANQVMKGAAKENTNQTKPTEHGKAEVPSTNFAITVQEGEEKQILVPATTIPTSTSAAPNGPSSSSSSAAVSSSAPNTSRIRDLPAEFIASPEGRAITQRLRKGVYATLNPNDQDARRQAEIADKSEGVPTAVPPPAEPLRSFMTQLSCLLVRDSFTILRDHRGLFIRFFLTLFMGFVVGTVFFRLGYSQIAAEERFSALFVCLLFIMFTANAFLPELFFARPMMFRERTSGAYSPLPFFLSRMFAQTPWILLENLPLAIMLVYISNLNQENTGRPLAYVYLCFVIVRFTSLTATYFIGAVLGQPNNANTIQATYFNLLFVFTGFLIHYDSIPVGWKWFADLNYLRWSFDFLAANEARNFVFECANDDYVLATPESFENICPSGIGSVTTVGASPSLLPLNAADFNSSTILKCQYACGHDMLQQWGIEYTDGEMARNLGIVACFGVAFGIAAFLAIKYIQHIKR